MGLLLRYNLRNLRARWKVTLLAIFGIALVVAAVVVISSMAAGFQIALSSTGSDNNAIVVQRGSMSELTSWIAIGNAQTIMTDPRIARDSEGSTLASCEIVVITSKPKKSDNQPTNITLRGVTPMAFKVRNGIKLVEGRMFSPGLLRGDRRQEDFRPRERPRTIGDAIRVQRKDFKVVGLFTADGSSFESEIWGDLNALGPAVRRSGGCESLTVRIKNPATIAAFDKDLRANPQMQVQAESERKYYEDQSGGLSMALKILAGFVGVVMGIGAVFGAMNTMYAIVSQRTREIGTLRALGFSRFTILLLVRHRVGVPGGRRRSLRLPAGVAHAGIHRRHWTDAELQRTGVCLPDHPGDRHRGHGVRNFDGNPRRPAACPARLSHADHQGPARSVEKQLSVISCRLSVVGKSLGARRPTACPELVERFTSLFGVGKSRGVGA